MKIGILTYHCIPNFGAQLQALSTVGFLKLNGHEPIVLNWYPRDLEEFYYKRAPKEQNKVQFEFAQKNMPVSNLCRTIPELTEEIKKLNLDAIILGSDALFDYTPEKHRYNFSLRRLKKAPIIVTSNHLLPNPFWGSFNDELEQKVPLYGYAISSQNMPYKDLNKNERIELARLLTGFKNITVRDQWTKNMVQALIGKENIPVVPDPVFAFNQNVGNIPSKKDIIEKYGLPEQYYLISFVYDILTEDYINSIIAKLESETSISCVSFPMPDKLKKFKTKYHIELPLDPIDWYALIKYSNGYIGERMHPIVVCLHNSIPFYCFDQYGTKKVIIPRILEKFIPESSKIYDILKKADLSSNSCFYNQSDQLNIDRVITHFLSFDKEKCKNFSENKLNEYNQSMHSLMK